MAKDQKAEKVKYTGTFVKPTKIGTKNPKKYKKGETFTTDNQSVYQSLIKNKILKK